MRKNRHRAPLAIGVPLALATLAAASWATVGLPGWADEQPDRSAARSAPATPPVACDTADAAGKGWYQAVYVHRAGTRPRADAVSAIRTTLWNVDQVFEASAQRFGQGDSRRPRFAQEAGCQAQVLTVGVDGDDRSYKVGQVRTKARALAEARLKEAGGSDRARVGRTRFVYFVDTGQATGCGVASAPAAKRRADLHTGWIAVNWQCLGEAALTHEMIHNFGVTHCDNDHDQGSDPICRGYDKSPRCDDIMGTVVLDCAKDEFAYFSPRPADGSRLARHPEENVANSPYLIKDQPAGPLDATLVGRADGECLTAGGDGTSLVQQPCAPGDSQTWRRAVGPNGYLTLRHLRSGRCLTMPSEGAPVLADCKPGDARQEWWMPSARGADRVYGNLRSRAAGAVLKLRGDGKQTNAPAERARTGGSPAAQFRVVPIGAAPTTGASTGAAPTTGASTGAATASAPSGRPSPTVPPVGGEPTRSAAPSFTLPPFTVPPFDLPSIGSTPFSPTPYVPAPESSEMPEADGAADATPEEENETEPDAAPVPGEDGGE
ncbi:RICIN domain-containing protein [Kitasatospora sp. NPDC002965]|uniref:RICIN domain-containing protein n=1 Tax=Kitasatospora sp. NPDC002965 TaxID=3154775 RepID=UPI0033B9FD2D